MSDDDVEAGSGPDTGAGGSGSAPEGDPYVRSWDEGGEEAEKSLDASQKDADSNFPATPVDDASSTCGTPRNSPSQSKDTPAQKTWIEYVLVDDKGKPVPDVRYRMKSSDGTMFDGAFDKKGKARIETINHGNCKIWILDVDGQEWKKG